MDKHTEADQLKVRLDKWLWAARFYKTRSLASDAIESGKIRVDGDRAKPAKDVKIGCTIHIRRKEGDVEIQVRALSNQRRGAPEAALLYEETEASKQFRLAQQEIHQSQVGIRERGTGRPTKRDGRLIKRFVRLDE